MQAEDVVCERPGDIDSMWDSDFDGENAYEERLEAALADARKKTMEEWYQNNKEDLQALGKVPTALQEYIPAYVKTAHAALFQGQPTGVQ